MCRSGWGAYWWAGRGEGTGLVVLVLQLYSPCLTFEMSIKWEYITVKKRQFVFHIIVSFFWSFVCCDLRMCACAHIRVSKVIQLRTQCKLRVHKSEMANWKWFESVFLLQKVWSAHNRLFCWSFLPLSLSTSIKSGMQLPRQRKWTISKCSHSYRSNHTRSQMQEKLD